MVQLGCSLKKLIFKVKVCNCDNQRMIEKTWKETKEEEGKYYLQKKLKSLANKLREVGKTTILLGVFKKSSSAGNARVIKRSKSKNQTSATHGKTFSLLLLKDLEQLWWFISNVTWKALTSLPCLLLWLKVCHANFDCIHEVWALKWIENFLCGWSSRQKIYKWIWNDSVKPFISQAQLDELDVKMKPSAKLTINFKSYQMK